MWPSPPSVSKIKKLENEVRYPLFDRLGRKVVLTDVGKMLLPRARTILGELQDIRLEMQIGIQEGHGTFAVGFIPTVAPFVLPAVIRRFSREFPEATLEVHD